MLHSILKSAPLLILAAVAGGLLLAFSFSPGTFAVAGATVETRVYPARSGMTVLKIPPLGEIKASTHDLPVGISLSLEQVTFRQVRRLADTNLSQGSLVSSAEGGVADMVRGFIVRLVVLGFLGGLAAGVIMPARNAKRAVIGALIGLMAVGAPTLAVVRDYDLKAWRQPRYSGMLAAAPWLIDAVEEKLNDFDAFRDEMGRIANNLYAFYSKVENFEPVELGQGRLRVLQVGDIHNNPVAFTLIRQLVGDFNVDLIVDTGDLTDLGTPLEAPLVETIGSLNVPYVFIPGNHDSPQILDALKQQPNVTVIENSAVAVSGLRIMGLSDPVAAEFSAVPAEGRRLAELIRESRALYRESKVPPDVVAVHSIKQAKAVVGESPVVLVGHTHRPSLTIRGNSVVANVGTSGAAGVRNFQVDEDIAYSFKLLHFDRSSRLLMAVDSLAFSGASRNFILERRLIDGTKERLPKRQGSGKLDLPWKPDSP